MSSWRSKGNKVNAKGRNPTSRFVRLDYRLLRSNAYRALSSSARSLLVELSMLFNGQNNGSLYLSVRDAALRLGLADVGAACRSFGELEELGFIEMTKEAHFEVKASEFSRARCWRLTWELGPGRKYSDCAFLKREPAPKTRAHKRMLRGLKALKSYGKKRDGGHLPVLDSETLALSSSKSVSATVLKTSTLGNKNTGLSPILLVPESSTHTAVTMGTGRMALLAIAELPSGTFAKFEPANSGPASRGLEKGSGFAGTYSSWPMNRLVNAWTSPREAANDN